MRGKNGPSAIVAPIASPSFPSQDGLLGDLLAIAGQPQEAHEIDEGRGEVVVPAELAGGVIVGEGVVVIVEAFAWNGRAGTRHCKCTGTWV